MARPYLHPDTGVYWIRMAVPRRLRELVGKGEEKRSLRTRDPGEAKVRARAAVEEIQTRWTNLEKGRQSLSESEAHELAEPIFIEVIEAFRHNPSEQIFWKTALYERMWEPKPRFEPGRTIAEYIKWKYEPDRLQADAQEVVSAERAEQLLERLGFGVDEESRTKVIRAVAAAFQRASLELLDRNRGNRPTAPSYYNPQGAISTKIEKSIFGLKELFDLWWIEAQATGLKMSTYISYKATMSNFETFVHKKNAEDVTVHDVVAFKDHRLATIGKSGRSISAKTVKDTDLVALKTVFGWAKRNKKLSINPAAEITIKVTKSARLREKGFTEDESRALLQAAIDHKRGRESMKTSAAKKWVPWLCAFTGARVGEIAQLRKEDVQQEGDIRYLLITPEAGTVKTNEARKVVLHKQVLDIGFLSYVDQCADGYLFINVVNGAYSGPLKALKNRLTEFARSVVSDPKVAPNHGWRHRFKTIGMEVGIAPRILDAIQGQAARTIADTYGCVTVKTMSDAIDKIPYIKVGQCSP